MKKESNYFITFSAMAQAAVRAAEELINLMADYRDVAAKANMIHDIEHKSDELLDEMTLELNRAFITPIDREDILAIGDELDSIIDAIEDVSNLLDMTSVAVIRPEAHEMAGIILEGCRAVSELISEFKTFKASKRFDELIKQVETLERKADEQYRRTIKQLYVCGEEVLTIMKWKDIYDTMEQVMDTCEDVARLLNGLAIKNS